MVEADADTHEVKLAAPPSQIPLIVYAASTFLAALQECNPPLVLSSILPQTVNG
jgi:hypothetical protein